MEKEKIAEVVQKILEIVERLEEIYYARDKIYDLETKSIILKEHNSDYPLIETKLGDLKIISESLNLKIVINQDDYNDKIYIDEGRITLRDLNKLVKYNVVPKLEKFLTKKEQKLKKEANEMEEVIKKLELAGFTIHYHQ